MSNKNKIHTKNKEYYTYFISNDIKEEIDKYSDDEKNEKILENIPENIIEQKTIKINNISKTKNFRKGKLHFTKNNNIVNLSYNGLINNISLDDINDIDNNSYIINNINKEVNNIIGLDKKDENYNIEQNITYNNMNIINNITLYKNKDEDDEDYLYNYCYYIKNNNNIEEYEKYNIFINIPIQLTDEENNKINFNTDLLFDYVDYINDYYVIYQINNKKYTFNYEGDTQHIQQLINIDDESDKINITYIKLTEENNILTGEIDFNNIEDYVILNNLKFFGEIPTPYVSLYYVNKNKKTLTRINNEIVKLKISDEENNIILYYLYNYNNKTLKTNNSLDLLNKTNEELDNWLKYYVIQSEYNIIDYNNFEIKNDNYDDKLYSNNIYSPTGTTFYNNYIENEIYYKTILFNLKQNYFGRYFKQFSAIDPEINNIEITYKGVSPIDIIEDTSKFNDENNEENEDNNNDDEEENDEETYEENGINNEIEEYYNNEEEENNEDNEIKPKIDDITDDNYYELITEIYRPKTIQKLLIPIQCLYSFTSIKNTSTNNIRPQDNYNINVNDLEFIKDINNSKIIFKNIKDNNIIRTVLINSTDTKIITQYIPLLILPTGELILKLNDLNINTKEYIKYGKELPEHARLTFEYSYIWMLRKINIPSFSINYDLNLDKMILKETDNPLDTTDYNTEYYLKNNNDLDVIFYTDQIFY